MQENYAKKMHEKIVNSAFKLEKSDIPELMAWGTGDQG